MAEDIPILQQQEGIAEADVPEGPGRSGVAAAARCHGTGALRRRSRSEGGEGAEGPRGP